MAYADRIQAQIQALSDLPMPDAVALEHSERLYKHLNQQISDADMPFVDFMQQILYCPGLGYYSAGSHKIGSGGDFITAPEMSPLFGAAIANQCRQVLQSLDSRGDMLEFGAGTGKLAVSIMKRLAALDSLPGNYYILEVSADLKYRQQTLIKAELPELFNRFVWLEELPQQFNGVVLANEVLDAMPVNLFRMRGESPKEQAVVLDEDDNWQISDAQNNSAEFDDWWQSTGKAFVFDDEYQSEVNLQISPWIKGLYDCIETGLVILIDYGYSRSEYYLEERNLGSLMCHYRHHNHPNPLLLPGLQDVTAHVDFTAVAEAGFDHGFDVLGYTTQGAFLMACGILDAAEDELTGEMVQQIELSQAIKPLIMPEEMGELFKVMTLGKEIDTVALGGLVGYQMGDMRRQL